MLESRFSGRYQELRPYELENWLAREPNLQIIDVREPAEYASGHIPGSRLIPLGQLQRRAEEIDAQRPAVLVCRSGNRSGMACRILGQMGYQKLWNLDGGMLDWRGPVA